MLQFSKLADLAVVKYFVLFNWHLLGFSVTFEFSTEDGQYPAF